MKRKEIIYIVLTIVILGVATVSLKNQLNYVQAETVQYTYDSLGRVKTAVYSDGTRMTYVYDNNGNMEEVLEDKIELPDDTQDSTTQESSSDANNNSDAGNNVTDSENGTSNIIQKPTIDFSYVNDELPSLRFNALDLSKRDVYAYNQFKKRKPVIKSLKVVKKNNAFYLKVQVRRLSNLTLYPETNYQIKYATNKRFKKAETLMVKRNMKKTLTAKTWKVKKNKTYYVKVRAYMKTKKGKKIYTKYSKVKKITVK